MVTAAQRSYLNNRELHKEATARFQESVQTHMLNGGNIGEVAHAMEQVRGVCDQGLQNDLASLLPGLQKFGFDLVALQAQSVAYDMEKGASVRFIDEEHPVVQAYADIHKIAMNDIVLGQAYTDLTAKHAEAKELLNEVSRRHGTLRAQ
jgi:hypothetical protein